MFLPTLHCEVGFGNWLGGWIKWIINFSEEVQTVHNMARTLDYYLWVIGLGLCGCGSGMGIILEFSGGASIQGIANWPD